MGKVTLYQMQNWMCVSLTSSQSQSDTLQLEGNLIMYAVVCPEMLEWQSGHHQNCLGYLHVYQQ